MKAVKTHPAQLTLWETSEHQDTRPEFLHHLPMAIPNHRSPKEDDSLFKDAISYALNRMSNTWKGIHTLSLTRNKDITRLEFMRRADGQGSALSITRNKDGTVTTHCCGQQWPGLPLDALRTAQNIFHYQIELELTRTALDMTDPQETIASYLNIPHYANNFLRNRAASLIASKLKPDLVSPDDLRGSRTKRQDEEDHERTGRHFRHLLRTVITDPNQTKTVRKNAGLNRSQPLNALQYNSPENPPAQTPVAPDFGIIGHRHLLAQAIDQVRPHVPSLIPVSYRETDRGTKFVDILWSKDHPPQLTITGHPDGHITLSDSSQLDKIHRFLFTQYSQAHGPARYTAKMLAAALAEIHPDPAQLLVHFPLNRNPRQPQNDLKETARDLISQNLQPAVLPKTFRKKNLKLADTGPTATRLVRTRLANPAAYEAAFTAGTATPWWPIRTYNHVALNGEMLAQHAANMPAVVAYYEKQLLDNSNMLNRLESPGQMVTIVREDLGLDNRLWKAFTRLEGRHYMHDRDAVIDTCQVLHEANRPNAQQPFLHALGSLAHINRRIRATGAHGDTNAWDGWVRCVNRFLDIQAPYQEEFRQQLQHMADAILHQARIDPERPWGPGEWHLLYARANAVLERKKNEIRELRAKTTWPSAIQTATTDGITFTALTNGAELDDYGDLMGNCLGSYTQRCSEGRDQVFVAHDQEQNLLAAVQLHNYGNGWKSVQTEAPRHSRVPNQIKKAAEELAKQYNQASQRQTLRQMEKTT